MQSIDCKVKVNMENFTAQFRIENCK